MKCPIEFKEPVYLEQFAESCPKYLHI